MAAEPLSIIELALKLGGFVVKPLMWVGRKTHYYFFRLHTIRLPITEAKAKQITYSILAGYIIRAIPYRNIGSNHIFIAALRADKEGGYQRKVYVLEQMGKTYLKVWASSDLTEFCDNVTNLEVLDIDQDGVQEVAFEESSWGTGFSSRTLNIYSTARKQLFKINELYSNVDAGGPIAPDIEFEGEYDKSYKKKLEAFAVKRGFFAENVTVNFDDPEFAEHRWHMENGDVVEGIVKLHFYDESSVFESSYEELDTDEILWKAYFKGPLVGYIKRTRKWFIAYSAANRYNWVTSLLMIGNCLWFSLHSKAGLMRFCFKDRSLYRYIAYRNKALPFIESVVLNGQILVINQECEYLSEEWRKVEIPLGSLDQLQSHAPITN